MNCVWNHNLYAYVCKYLIQFINYVKLIKMLHICTLVIFSGVENINAGNLREKKIYKTGGQVLDH